MILLYHPPSSNPTSFQNHKHAEQEMSSFNSKSEFPYRKELSIQDGMMPMFIITSNTVFYLFLRSK